MSFRILAAGGLASALLAFPHAAHAQYTIGCAAAPASIGPPTVTAPAPGQALPAAEFRPGQPSIFYVTGTVADVAFDIDVCNAVTGVVWAGAELPRFGSGGIDQAAQSWELLGYQALGNGKARATVRLRFANSMRGVSPDVRIRVQSPAGTPGYLELVIVGVRRIDTQGEMLMTQAELKARFLDGIAKRFGRSGRDGSLHSPDYGNARFDLTTAGITFSLKVVKDLYGPCDPTATMSGTFRLTAAQPLDSFPNDLLTDFFAIEWPGEPTVALSWGLGCAPLDALEVAPLVSSLVRWIEEPYFQGPIADMKKSIEESFAALHGGPGGRPVHSIEHRAGSVLIRLKAIDGHTVVVDVPYGSQNLAPAFGIAVPASVMIVPGGSAQVARRDYNAAYGTVVIGPGGLRNPRTNVPGLDGGLWPYGGYGMGWDGYYYALDQLDRDPAGLPLPDDNVGALVARADADPVPFLVGSPCGFAGRQRLSLATNDRPTGAGSGNYEVTLLLGVSGGACGHGTPHVGGGIRTHWMRHGGELGFLGRPLTIEIPTGDGRGWSADFSGGTIVFTWTTGAVEIHGGIRDTWRQLGGNRAAVGYPTSDEQPAADGVGRFNRFENGAIYWHPSIGTAFEVRNGNYAKWRALGGETGWLGYPTTNESLVGRGAFNFFQNGAIYWSPEFGMIAMDAQLRDAYQARGGPTGAFGFPTQDQGQWSTSVGPNRFVIFEHGWIVVAANGAVTSATF